MTVAGRDKTNRRGTRPILIVIDASAVLDLLLRKPGWQALDAITLATDQRLHAPHLLDIEIAQAVRRHGAAGEISPARGLQALTDLSRLPITRYPHDQLLSRIWELRHNMSAYDSSYVALAEILGARLLTRDEKLAAAVQRHTTVGLV